ncbi:MAG: nickel pincer cofactor biosynthesis protein LarC [Lachnospiraceae bacterium]|nr:nickel pincer cofactor biosynthesis protein LarC [Lachnospiraceae bacterium]
MKTIFIDCSMGAAGDMLTAALLDLFPEKEEIVKELNMLKIPGVEYRLTGVSKCGISGAKMDVFINGEREGHEFHDHDDEKHGSHGHNSMHRIEDIVSSLDISEKVKKDVLSVYSLLAEAESKVHGVPVKEIHFHEVGNMDAVADITAVCYLMDRLSPGRISASPVNTGSGTVHCAHGVLPVPAPATAELLKEIPSYNDGIQGELTTPTGAALLKYYVKSFGNMPVMKTKAIGYGMGNKDFERANCVRIFTGETGKEEVSSGELKDRVLELSCNIDDMTAEEIAFAMEGLMTEGALDVYTSSIVMKKGRPGTLFSVLCREEDGERFAALIFKLTTTIGIRKTVHERYVLKRETETVTTPYGDVRVKKSSGYGVTREKYEYEDISRIAKEQGESTGTVLSDLFLKNKSERTVPVDSP